MMGWCLLPPCRFQVSRTMGHHRACVAWLSPCSPIVLEPMTTQTNVPREEAIIKQRRTVSGESGSDCCGRDGADARHGQKGLPVCRSHSRNLPQGKASCGLKTKPSCARHQRIEGKNASARRLKALITNLGAECAQSGATARGHHGNTALAMSLGLRTRRTPG